MTTNEMVLCVTVGISAGIIFKLIFELLFFCVRKIQTWLLNQA